MRRLALALLIGILSAPTASAYRVIRDPEVFYSRYANPKVVIDFTELKDGTAIENLSIGYKPQTAWVSDPSYNCLISADKKDDNNSSASLAVSSQAFSDDWSFRGADPTTPGLFCEVITWFVQGITSGKYHLAVSAAAGRSEPFAMYTSTGFIGVIPGTPKEADFIFDTFNTVFSFETGYSEVKPEPKPILTPHKERDYFAANYCPLRGMKEKLSPLGEDFSLTNARLY
jgi:hypothetical protein